MDDRSVYLHYTQQAVLVFRKDGHLIDVIPRGESRQRNASTATVFILGCFTGASVFVSVLCLALWIHRP